MDDAPPKAAPKRRHVPDKYLAVALFVLLLVVYLSTKDAVVEKLLFGAFTLVCTAIGDGLRRVSEWSANRLKSRGRDESTRA